MINPRVDAFIHRAPKWQAEMKALRKILLGCSLIEEIKWGKPCYTAENSNIVIMQPFKEHLSLMFFKGALLKDTRNLLKSQGENTQYAMRIEFTNSNQVNSLKPTLEKYIKQAIEIEKTGLQIHTNKKAPLDLPGAFQTLLNKDKEYKKAFAALTPGRQRSYLIHFKAAKQEKTLLSRIEKCKPKVLQGKGFNEL